MYDNFLKNQKHVGKLSRPVIAWWIGDALCHTSPDMDLGMGIDTNKGDLHKLRIWAT